MIPTEPIGSVPRSDELLAAMQAAASGSIAQAELDALFDDAVRDTIARMEETGSPVVSDGEQRKPSFATSPVHGLASLGTDGVVIPFADGHTRQLPVITEGPFRVDFTEGRLALKLDPSGGLVRSFVELNNSVLDRFDSEERRKIGVHSCPGGDHDSTHSADVDYAALLPLLFELRAGSFYLELAGESDPESVLGAIAANVRPEQRVFVGVIDPIDARVETAEEVRDRVLLAAKHIPLEQLGTTDDCGFSPFADDRSTARETAFAKIRARVEGTALASSELGV